MEYLNIREKDRLLVVAPHPDDECIGVGGLLLSYRQNCEVIVLTDGCIGQGAEKQEVTRDIRKREFNTEMDALGIENWWMLNIPDGRLTDHVDCLKEQDLSGYTKIFVTGAKDGHPDHQAAFHCVLNAVRHQCVDVEIYAYEVHAPLLTPTHMLDITELMEEKKELIRFHSSQLVSFPYDDFAETTAKYRAMQNRRYNSFVEVYEFIPASFDKVFDENYDTEKKLYKQIKFYQLLTRWLDKRNKGRYICDFLKNINVHEIAVYGFAELGKLTVDELMMSDMIHVSYVLDKKTISDETGIRIVRPVKDNPPVDAVIVTAISSYDEIREELEALGYTNVYSLDEVVDKM